MKIDRSNYEIWIIDWLDGSLSDSQAEELKLFLNENPDIRSYCFAPRKFVSY